MKKIILSTIFLCTVHFMNAQEEGYSKGNIMLTGGFGFKSESTGDNKTNGFNVNPKVGYFVTSNIAAGLAIGFSNSKEENPVTITKNNQLSAGLFGRYYFTPAQKFSFFGELGFNILSGKTETITAVVGPIQPPTVESKFNGFNFALAPGVNYFLSKNFALETSIGVIGYRSVKPKDAPGSNATNTFDIGFNLANVNLGLIYKF
jgi:outer membrane protein W